VTTDSATTGARAVDRAAALLVAVVGTESPMSFAELVTTSGLPKSTVSRLLSSLERNALISRTSDSSVIPGPALAAFARTYRSDNDLIALARPSLVRLGAATGETINLAVPTEAGVLQIDQIDPRFMLGAVNWLDREVPYHVSALGKTFLAFGTPLPSGRLTSLTERSITTRAALDAELELTRQRGYAIADGELEPGLLAIAAPVLSENNVAVAAISVSGPSARITAPQLAHLGSILVTEAREVSALLNKSRTALTSPRKAGAA